METTPFGMVIESAPTAAILVRAAGGIALVNRQVELLFGYPREELLDGPVERLVPARFAPHAGLRTDYLMQPAPHSMGVGRDLYGLRKDGSESPVRNRSESRADRRIAMRYRNGPGHCRAQESGKNAECKRGARAAR